MKNIRLFIVITILTLTVSCQEDFLEVTPKGSLDSSILATPDGVDKLLIGAYAMLDGVSSNGFGWEAAASNWVFGSIRGLEANKGSDAGDQPDINPIQTYTETATNPYLEIKWGSIYEGIARTNEMLTVLAVAEENGTISSEQATSFRLQGRALRGHYHLEAWKIWRDIIYIDENTDLTTVTNTSGDVGEKIIADLQAATALPNNMEFVGRFNGTVARVLLAKALMQINGDYNTAKGLLETVVSSGTAPDGSEIGLMENYGDIFNAANRNDREAIYTVQYSVNDGSGGWNAGQGEVLNFPYKPGESPGGCCGFFQPSHTYVNAFLTQDGLPMLDGSFNDNPIVNDQGLTPQDNFEIDPRPVDPRLDWSVGRRGIPYLDWGLHTGRDWVRDQNYAGPYSPKKQVYEKGQEGQFTEVGNWTSGWTANGYRMIRYADVLLLLAECQIETNDLNGARENINLVRARAANPDGFVKNVDGSDAANYQISLYPDSGFPFDNRENAHAALRMERLLELGMEGHRYFDLQRWDMVNSLNDLLDYEKQELPTLYGDATVGSEDNLYPIPQNQIDIMGSDRLVQNR